MPAQKKGGVILLGLSFLLWASSSMGQEPKYVTVKNCKTCHTRQYKSWRETRMAKTFDLLKPEEQTKPECLICHTTGYGKEGGFKNLEETPTMTEVQCEACHGPASSYYKAPLLRHDRVSMHLKIPKLREEACIAATTRRTPTIAGHSNSRSIRESTGIFR